MTVPLIAPWTARPAIERTRARFDRYCDALDGEIATAQQMPTDRLEARHDAAGLILKRRRRRRAGV